MGCLPHPPPARGQSRLFIQLSMNRTRNSLGMNGAIESGSWVQCIRKNERGLSMGRISFRATVQRNTKPQAREKSKSQTPDQLPGKRRTSRFLSLEIGGWNLKLFGSTASSAAGIVQA